MKKITIICENNDLEEIVSRLEDGEESGAIKHPFNVHVTDHDLQAAHRLEVLESINWNLSPREAAKLVDKNIAEGKGGSATEWIAALEAFFRPNDCGAILHCMKH